MLSRYMAMPPLPFEELNEADVRAEVIDPLLRRLGYRSGTRNNVIREQPLRYPKLFLGRKNPKKDPPLRGKADYTLVVEDRLRWVLEAKAPAKGIDTDDIEQAWTYASHGQVRAIYFVVCNGRTLLVHRTVDGPDSAPLLSVSYEALDQDFLSLASLLAPESLLRDFPDLQPDVGPPIAPGLRSIARVTNGIISFRQDNLGSEVFKELQATIRDGSIGRDENGRLFAFLKTVVPMRSWQETNERLRVSNFEMSSEASDLALEGESPTIFRYEGTVTLAAGETLFNAATWKPATLPVNLTLNIATEASGTYRDRVFSGSFMTRYSGMVVDVMLSGSFEVNLA